VTTAIITLPICLEPGAVIAFVIEVRDVKEIVGVQKGFLYFELILKG
jgi:hypothetical protein